jgi:hypothetical protein
MQNKIVKGISEGIKMYAERKDNWDLSEN